MRDLAKGDDFSIFFRPEDSEINLELQNAFALVMLKSFQHLLRTFLNSAFRKIPIFIYPDVNRDRDDTNPTAIVQTCLPSRQAGFSISKSYGTSGSFKQDGVACSFYG
jgi:hypothetical protein